MLTEWNLILKRPIFMLFSFFCIVSILAITAIFINSSNNSKAQISALNFLQKEISNASIELSKINSLGNTLVNIAPSMPGTKSFFNFEREIIPFGDEHPAKMWFLSSLTSYPQITTLQIGYENGTYYSATNLKTALPSMLEEQSDPNDSTFLIRRIVGNIMGRLMTGYF